MPRFSVRLEHKSTFASVDVMYESPDYREAWVGARSVCRLGTLFEDDPRRRPKQQTREFYNEDGSRFETGPAVYVVRRILAENTRKRGRPRMTTLSIEDVRKILAERNVKVSAKVDAALEEVLGAAAGGLQLTVAAARRLGVPIDEEENGGE